MRASAAHVLQTHIARHHNTQISHAPQPPGPTGGSEYLTFQRVVSGRYQLPPGFPPAAADLVSRLLVLKREERLGGEKGAVGGKCPPGAHAALWAHPFLDAHRDFPEQHSRRPPPPTLRELALPVVAHHFAQGGWHRAALGGKRAAEWPPEARDAVAFEIHKMGLLNDECRQALALGPPPKPILDAEFLPDYNAEGEAEGDEGFGEREAVRGPDVDGDAWGAPEPEPEGVEV